MRIGIDARFYGTLGKGLGRYTSELITQLEQIDTDNDYFIFLRQENFNDYTPKNPRFTKILAEFPWYSWQEQIIFPFWLSKFQLNLIHFLHFNVPLLYRRPFVVTIHDLILLHHPTTRATTLGPLRFAIKYFFYRIIIAHALKYACTILTVSNYTKQEIEKKFPYTKQKQIIVTYEACATTLCAEKIPSTEKITRVRNLTKPFLLYVGNAYPHKNLEKLIHAFQEFRTKDFRNYHLVLVGSSDYFYNRLKNEAIAMHRDENIIFFGRASEEELSELYTNATFYVFPSLCEGFGLPPLEAMCKGLPVTSSNATCLPEILDNAVYFFDPNSLKEMTNALTIMAKDDNLRLNLIQKGKTWANRFSWSTCAATTKKVYLRSIDQNA